MKATGSPKKQKKKRNCYDRLRKQLLDSRRSRKADPAGSAALQLLSIFTAIFGRMPEAVPKRAYVPYIAPPLSPNAARRAEMSRRLGVPARYLDVVMTQGHVSYRVLFDHIRRGGVQRRDAMLEFRKRAPAASLDWLDYIQNFEQWSDLVRCYVPNEQDEQTDIKVLDSTLRWLENQRCEAMNIVGVLLGNPAPDDSPLKRSP